MAFLSRTEIRCQRRSSSTLGTRTSDPESGFVLLAVLIMVALIFIGLSVAVPKITTDIQRDKETELYHRGTQYARAVRTYYKKFGRFPGSIEQLENTNDIRFLRKRYKDPITGKDDWKIIHFGEATVPVLGLFGQPLNGTNTGNGTQGGQQGAGGPSMYAPPQNPDGTTEGSGDASTGNQNPTGSNMNGSNLNGSNVNGSNVNGASPIGSTPIGSDGMPSGGGPVVGVASSSTKESIRLFRKQSHYNQWEFIYDPLEDSGANTGVGMVPQQGQNNINGAGNPGGLVPSGPIQSPNGPSSPQQ